MIEPEVAFAGDGGDVYTKHTALDEGGWEEFFQYRELEMLVHQLENRCTLLESNIAEILRTIESSRFIKVNDGFATYVPRNRRSNG